MKNNSICSRCSHHEVCEYRIQSGKHLNNKYCAYEPNHFSKKEGKAQKTFKTQFLVTSGVLFWLLIFCQLLYNLTI